ncbi:MAG: LPS export ABC transporter permease LptG [Desulfobacterales bacterium]|nr:LPS export ABC transporter permease LptG [Desulfobacterales bacterium]
MSIVHKYLAKEIFKYIGIVLGAVVSIYVAVDFFEKVDDFIEANIGFSKIITFFIFETPFIIFQIIPVCILLSVLVVFGLMSKNNEIVALKSSGVSVYYLLKPVLFIGFVATVLLFLFSDIIVPITREKANNIWLRQVRHDSFISKYEDIWLKDNRLIVHIKSYNKDDESVSGLTLNFFDDDFRLQRRIDAKKGVFRHGKWVLYDLMEQVLDKEKKGYNIIFHEKMAEKFNLLPEDMKRVAKKSEEMSFSELREYIKKVETEGYDATTYRVDLFAKIAFPFVCIVMCLAGTGVALRGKMKDGLPVSITYGIGIAFFYWIFYSFCVSLGYGEVLPPVISVWTANFVFICFGVLLLLNAE